MVILDASKLTARELNQKLKELSKDGAEITIVNPEAQHNIGVGIIQPCKIHIKGSVGYFAGSMSDGAEFTIDGNAGWALAENMMSGKVVLTKDAGASVASTIRGGEVYVGGNAGARAGISMKGGTLIVKGNSGFLTGFMMQKGCIIVCGDVGEAVADSMYEGVIYVGGKIGSLGTDSEIQDISEGELIGIWETLEQYGIDEKSQFTKVVSSKKLYHFDSLERLEKTVI